MKLENKLQFIIFVIAVALIYRGWFSPGFISGGDWGGFYLSNIKDFSLHPFGWYALLGKGFGGGQVAFLWSTLGLSIPIVILGQFLNVGWELISRLGYFFPFLLLSIISSYKLFRFIFPKIPIPYLSSFIFVANTFILMMVGGGQIVIALAYAFSPLVLINMIKVSSNPGDIKNSLYAGLLFGVLAFLDLRIGYIILFAAILYIITTVQIKEWKNSYKKLLITFLIIGSISIMLNAYWILPTLVTHQNPIEQASSEYTDVSAVKFFSFANLEQSLSLLHPNWPENIFGKVGFMRPEFLLLPMLAFSSLLFINNKTKKILQKREEGLNIIYFALLGLLGAFLAKGANEPFGNLYIWFFEHVPGFVMFRDASKWYMLVALSFSVLIPFAIWSFYTQIKNYKKIETLNIKFKLHNIFLILIVIYMLCLIQPAFWGQLKGTFKPIYLSTDYIALEKYLTEKPQFFRTLWIPRIERYGAVSLIHPGIPANEFFNADSSSSVISILNKESSHAYLRNLSVKYIVVPADVEKEIFLKDRKYNKEEYLHLINSLNSISWITNKQVFGGIRLYEVPNPRDHFWSPSNQMQIAYNYINPSKYQINVRNAKRGDTLVFSEQFNPDWEMKIDSSNEEIGSKKYLNQLNSFELPKEGNYQMHVVYKPQIWIDRGLIISICTFIGSIVSLLYFIHH